MKVKVTCKFIVHGPVSAKHGQVIELPDAVAQSLINNKKAEAVTQKEKKA
jgi:hypothetical protein